MIKLFRLSITATFLMVYGLLSVNTSAHAAGLDTVKEGQELFNSFGCYQCHGHYGQGGGRAGPKLAPNPYPYEAFKIFVRTPIANMPPYTEKVLSEDQLKKIHMYLQSFEKGPSADEIPIMDLANQ